MATKEILLPVSGNANQAVANDDFEAYQREANKSDLEAKFGKPAAAKADEPVVVEKKDESLAPKKRNGELSYKELRDRVKALESENQTLKTPREPEKKEVVEVEEKKPETLRARPKPDEVADGKPKYKDWTEYEDDLLAWNTEKTIRTLDERNAKLTAEQQVEVQNKTIEQSWRERTDKSRELHADYDEVALAEDGPGKLITPGSLIDEWLMDSENGAELLYYFGQHPEELKKFEDVDKNFGGTPTTRRAAARRALVRLEDKLVAAPEKEKKPSEVDAARSTANEPRVTKAPKPTTDVGGRGTSLPDPVQAAIADGSDAATSRYIEEQNRRDFKARFGDSRR